MLEKIEQQIKELDPQIRARVMWLQNNDPILVKLLTKLETLKEILDDLQLQTQTQNSD